MAFFCTLVNHSFALRELGFEESYFVYLVISCRNTKALTTAASCQYRLTPHDPLVACMCDVGINQCRLCSARNIYDDIETHIRYRYV